MSTARSATPTEPAIVALDVDQIHAYVTFMEDVAALVWAAHPHERRELAAIGAALEEALASNAAPAWARVHRSTQRLVRSSARTLGCRPVVDATILHALARLRRFLRENDDLAVQTNFRASQVRHRRFGGFAVTMQRS